MTDMRTLTAMLHDENGFGNIVYGAVGLVIFLIMVSAIVMPTIFNTNTAGTFTCGKYSNTTCGDNWDVSTLAMWAILPIVVVASAILFVLGKK